MFEASPGRFDRLFDITQKIPQIMAIVDDKATSMNAESKKTEESLEQYRAGKWSEIIKDRAEEPTVVWSKAVNASNEKIKKLFKQLKMVNSKAFETSEKLDKETDSVKKIILIQELFALEELISHFVFSITDEAVSASENFPSSKTEKDLKDRVSILKDNFTKVVEQILEDKKEFSKIRNLFQETIKDRFDKNVKSNIEQERKNCLLQFQLSTETPSLEYYLGKKLEFSLSDELEQLQREIDAITTTLETKSIHEFGLTLKENELLLLKVTYYQKQILLNQKKIELGTAKPDEVRALKKKIMKLEFQEKAQEKLNIIILKQRVTWTEYLGSGVSTAADAGASVYSYFFSSDEKQTSRYNWETHAWKKLLAPQTDIFSGYFQKSINALKDEALKIDARILIYRDEYAEINKKLKGGKTERTIKELMDQKELLEGEIKNFRADRQDLRIAIRAAFLKKIIKGIGDRQKIINDHEAQMNSNAIGIKAAELHEDKQNEIIKYETKNKNLQKNNDNIQKEIDALINGYKKQLKKYKSLDKPERPFLKQLQKFGLDKIKDLVSLGFVSTTYNSPQEFEMEMEFAKFGYNWLDSIKTFADQDTDNVIIFLEKQIEDFYLFAETNPELAINLVGDVALTFSCLRDDETMVNKLLSGVRSRCYTRSVLPQFGHNVKEIPRLNPETFKAAAKWRAFGQLIEYGPLLASGTEAIKAAAGKLAEGNLIGAVTSGIVSGVKSGATNTTAQNITKKIRPCDEAGVIAILGVLSGQNVKDILEEQRNIALLKIASGARDLIFHPFTSFKGLKSIFYNQIEAIKQASIPEKIFRVGVLFVAPPAIAVGGIALGVVLFNPAGLVATLTVGIAALVAAVTIPYSFLTFINNFGPFKSTMVKAFKARARNLINQHRDELMDEKNQYLFSLRNNNVIVDINQPNMLEDEIIFTQEQQEQCQTVIEKLKETLKNELEAAFKIWEKTNPGLEFKPKDVRDIFIKIGEPSTLFNRIKTEIQKGFVSFTEEDKPSKKQIDNLAKFMMKDVSLALQNEWFEPKLILAYENQFVIEVCSYASPEQYNCETLKEKLKEDLTKKLNQQIDSEKRSDIDIEELANNLTPDELKT